MRLILEVLRCFDVLRMSLSNNVVLLCCAKYFVAIAWSRYSGYQIMAFDFLMTQPYIYIYIYISFQLLLNHEMRYSNLGDMLWIRYPALRLWAFKSPISQIPQCISPIPHNTPLGTEMYTFLFQRGAFRGVGQVHYWICDIKIFIHNSYLFIIH